MKLRQLRNKGECLLRENAVDDYSFDAFQLVLNAAGITKDEYYLADNNEISAETENKFFADINRRISGDPLQYILGRWDFYESVFYVGEGVLIPRPETEELVGYCIDTIKKNSYSVVYDLCSGSGCIGLSIAKACPDVHCYLFELYDDALFYLNKNLAEMKLPNVTVIKCNVLQGSIPEIPDCDLLVSNPPYIPHDEVDTLEKEVLREPHTALDGGNDGLDFYRSIYEKWTCSIRPYGGFAFECAEDQCERIVDMFSQQFESTGKKDMYSNGRFVFGKKKTVQ